MIGFSIVFLRPPQAKLQEGVLWVWLVTTSRLSDSLHYHIIKEKSGCHRADSLVLGMLGRTLHDIVHLFITDRVILVFNHLQGCIQNFFLGGVGIVEDSIMYMACVHTCPSSYIIL